MASEDFPAPLSATMATRRLLERHLIVARTSDGRKRGQARWIKDDGVL